MNQMREYGFLLVLLITCGHAQESAKIASPSYPPSQGRVDGQVYRNDALGLTYRLPDGFEVQQNGAAALGSSSVMLVIADQHTGRPLKNRIIIAATDARNYQWSTKQFAEHFVASLPDQAHVAITRGAGLERIVGQDFYQIEFRKMESGQALYQAFVCTRWKDAIVNWTFVSSSEQEMAQMTASIQSAHFLRNNR